jgi:hypothetical protein
VTGEMWMTTGVWVTIIGAIAAGMRWLTSFVTKAACHAHGKETLEKIDDLAQTVADTNTKVDHLAGYIEAKFDGMPHTHHRQGD